MMEEKEIIKEFKKGDPAAFDAIYHKYSRKLYNLALGLLKDPYSAGEIVQEVFVRLWEKRSQVNVALNFENYIVTITYNSIRNHYKRKSIEAKVKDYLQNNCPGSINNTDSSVLYNELFELACKTIDKLSPQRKTVYNLSRKEGMKIKQIARTLNISPRTAENHLSKALKYLKDELAKISLTALVIYNLYVFTLSPSMIPDCEIFSLVGNQEHSAHSSTKWHLRQMACVTRQLACQEDVSYFPFLLCD